MHHNKNHLLYALLLAGLGWTSCQREENVKTDDGLTFCPLNWVYLKGNASCNGAYELSGYAVRDSALLLADELREASYTAFIQGQTKQYDQTRFFVAQGNFECTAELSPVAVSEGSMFDFRMEPTEDSVFTDLPSFGFYSSPHSITVTKTATGFDIHGLQGNERIPLAADLPDFARALLSIRRVGAEGGGLIFLRARVFDAKGQLLADKEVSSVQMEPLLTPGFKICQAPAYRGKNVCSAMQWRLDRYTYTGEGRGTSDDFHCNTVYNLP